MSEFELLEHYFLSRAAKHRDHRITLGVGDDAAVLTIPVGQELVVSMDTLVAGKHFPHNTPPEAVAHKALAVNMSDLAAMAATPAWVTLSLTLPANEPSWLEPFCDHFFKQLHHNNIALIGGDLSAGPLSITLQAHGLVDAGKAVRRSTAQPGDVIYVTGTFGDAGLGLKAWQERIALPDSTTHALYQQLHYPEPRVPLIPYLQRYASAAIDVSDGLAADLTHILQASHVGATIALDQLPLSEALKSAVSHTQALQLALSAGDDYELCFTVSPDNSTRLQQQPDLPCPIHAIGVVEATPGLRYSSPQVPDFELSHLGWQHF